MEGGGLMKWVHGEIIWDSQGHKFNHAKIPNASLKARCVTDPASFRSDMLKESEYCTL